MSGEDDLLDIVKTLQEHYGSNTLLLDEIHFISEPAQTLKKLYDFRNVKVIFTCSVALAMRQSAYDLSRRVKLLTLFPFSFREYLRFKEDVYLDKLSLEQLINRRWDPQHLRTGRHFDKYLKDGILPFSMHEPDPLPLLGGIIAKVVSRDMPSIEKLTTGELPLIRKRLQFVGTSAVDGINYSSLSRNLGITKYKAKQYIHYLEKAFVLHRVFPEGTNVLREPKALMAPPCRLLYRDYKDAVGGLCEDFCVESLPAYLTKSPAANADSATATARIGKTPDCSMSIRLLRSFTNWRPLTNTYITLFSSEAKTAFAPKAHHASHSPPHFSCQLSTFLDEATPIE